jgi:hypothetical protein
MKGKQYFELKNTVFIGGAVWEKKGEEWERLNSAPIEKLMEGVPLGILLPDVLRPVGD